MFFRKAFVFFVFFFSAFSFAESSSFIELNEEDSIIVELKLKKFIISEAVVAYHSTDYTFVSLEEFLIGIDYPITLDFEEKWASGWFITEDKTFELNFDKQELYIAGQKIELGDDFRYSADDWGLYVDIRDLEQWFDLRIELVMDRLQLVIDSDVAQPIEQKVKRDKTRLKKKVIKRKKKNYPVVPDRYIALGNPAFDIQLNSSTDQNDTSYGYSIQGVGDVLYHETRLVHNLARQDTPTNTRLTFYRNALREGDDIFAGITSYSVGDVYSQGDNLVARSSSGVGVQLERAVSSSVDDSFSRRDFEGDAPPGWEVELYRNDLLIDFQFVDDSGRYIFKDIALQFGENHFEIKIYGPQGQKRTESQRISIGSALITPGQYQFYSSFMQQDELLIGDPQIASTGEVRNQFTSTAYYGLTTRNTIGVGINRASPSSREEEHDYGRLTWISAFNRFTTRLDYAQDIDYGGDAYSFDLTGRAFDQSFNLSHRQFNEFSSSQNNSGSVQDESELNLFGGINLLRRWSIPYSLGFTSTTSATGLQRYRVENRLGYSFGRIRFSNQVAASGNNETDDIISTGTLSIAQGGTTGQTRGSLNYDIDTGEALSVSLGKTINGEKWRMQMAANSNFTGEKLSSLSITGSRLFDDLSMSLSFQGTDQDTWAVGLTLELGVHTTNQKPFYYTERSGNIGTGVAKAKVFLDNNGNSIFDEGDEPLSDIGFKGRISWTELKTDENGIVSLPEIDPVKGSIVRLDTLTLSDPFLQPNRPELRVMTHSGGKPEIIFPIQETTEIEGNILVKRGENIKGVGGVPVGLYRDGELVKTVTTEFDGYYLMTGVVPGEYIVDIADEDGVMTSYQWTKIEPFFADMESGLYVVDEILLEKVEE